MADDFLKDISNLLRDTDDLLMEFDMQSPSLEVIEVQDDSILGSSTSPSSTPDRNPTTTGSTTRTRRRGSTGTTARGRPRGRRAQAIAEMLSPAIDLCSPMPPPPPPPPAPSTSSRATGRRATTTGRTRRRGRGSAAAGWIASSPVQAVLSAVQGAIDLCSPLAATAGGSGSAGGRRGRATNVTLSSDDSMDDIIALDLAGPSTSSSNAPPPPSMDDSQDGGSMPSCPICLSKWQSPVSTQCGHIFCKNCITQWLRQTKKCPVCKATGPKLKIHPIFIS